MHLIAFGQPKSATGTGSMEAKKVTGSFGLIDRCRPFRERCVRNVLYLHVDIHLLLYARSLIKKSHILSGQAQLRLFG